MFNSNPILMAGIPHSKTHARTRAMQHVVTSQLLLNLAVLQAEQLQGSGELQKTLADIKNRLEWLHIYFPLVHANGGV